MAVEDGKFIVDADAAAAAKVDGDYTHDGTGVKEEEGKEGDKPESLISDEDPGDDEDGDESDKDSDDGDEDGEEEEEEEGNEKPTEFETHFSGWTDEFMADGQLSDDTRKEVLETVFSDKVPESMRQDFIAAYEAGLTSIRADTTRSVFDLVGGQDNYQNMLQWGVENLSPEETEVFDKATLGTDPGVRTAAVKGLYAQMQQAKGVEPDFTPDLSHGGNRSGGEPIIASRQELAKIQATDEYKKDPALRAKVARQLKQSMDTGKYISD
jgi:hypothetical protein